MVVLTEEIIIQVNVLLPFSSFNKHCTSLNIKSYDTIVSSHHNNFLVLWLALCIVDYFCIEMRSINSIRCSMNKKCLWLMKGGEIIFYLFLSFCKNWKNRFW